jgi:type III secretory pathway component EscR
VKKKSRGWEEKSSKLTDNGENSPSVFLSNQQQDISDTHEREIMKDSFHIMQPSNMLCNVASTSICNNYMQ